MFLTTLLNTSDSDNFMAKTLLKCLISLGCQSALFKTTGEKSKSQAHLSTLYLEWIQIGVVQNKIILAKRTVYQRKCLNYAELL